MGALEVAGDQNENQGHEKKKKVDPGKRSRGLAVLRDQEKKMETELVGGQNQV